MYLVPQLNSTLVEKYLSDFKLPLRKFKNPAWSNLRWKYFFIELGLRDWEEEERWVANAGKLDLIEVFLLLLIKRVNWVKLICKTLAHKLINWIKKEL